MTLCRLGLVFLPNTTTAPEHPLKIHENLPQTKGDCHHSLKDSMRGSKGLVLFPAKYPVRHTVPDK